MKRMMAATRAPTSGRASSRLDHPSCTRLEASACAPRGAAVAVAVAAAGSAVVGAAGAADDAPEGVEVGSWLMLVSSAIPGPGPACGARTPELLGWISG